MITLLAISHGAAQVIKEIVSSSQMPDDGGIRISAQPLDEESLRLDLSLATSPEAGDAVVEEEGAKVFVDQTVAPYLENKILDAAVEADKVSFSIVDGQPNWSSNGQPKDVDPRGLI